MGERRQGGRRHGDRAALGAEEARQAAETVRQRAQDERAIVEELRDSTPKLHNVDQE